MAGLDGGGGGGEVAGDICGILFTQAFGDEGFCALAQGFGADEKAGRGGPGGFFCVVIVCHTVFFPVLVVILIILIHKLSVVFAIIWIIGEEGGEVGPGGVQVEAVLARIVGLIEAVGE